MQIQDTAKSFLLGKVKKGQKQGYKQYTCPIDATVANS